MIEHSPDIAKLITALHAAQGEVAGVEKNARNPHFKNRYATLEAVIDAAKPALQKHGLAFTQAPGALVNGAVEITTMLMHTSGQWLRSTLHVPLARTDPQGVGSAITYGSRYSLMAMLGLPPVDDDGESAHGRGGPFEPARRTAPEPERQADAFGLPPLDDEDSRARYIREARTRIGGMSEAQLRQWWDAEKTTRRDLGLTQDEVDGLKAAIAKRIDDVRRAA